MKIWIDDIRTPPDSTWTWFKTSKNSIKYLNWTLEPSQSWIERREISFDHDLGEDDTTRPVVIWMIENNVRFDKYNVHSANPVGRDWLEGMIERYLA